MTLSVHVAISLQINDYPHSQTHFKEEYESTACQYLFINSKLNVEPMRSISTEKENQRSTCKSFFALVSLVAELSDF